MSIESIVEGVHSAGGAFLDFLLRPRRLVERQLSGHIGSVRVTVAWCIACIVLIASANSQLSPEGQTLWPDAPGASLGGRGSPGSPSLANVRWNWQPRLDIMHRTSGDGSSVLVLSMGSVKAEVIGLTSKAATSSFILCVLLLYGFSLGICLHPVTMVLGTKQALRVSISFVTLLVAFSALQLALLTTPLLVLWETRVLTSDGFWISWSLLAVIPWVVTAVRAYFLGVGNLHGFSRKRTTVAIGGAIAASMVIGPCIYLPGLRLIFWAREWIDILL